MAEIRSKNTFPAPEEDIYTISRLNREVRYLLEEVYPSIWIEGEISNLAKPGSGHFYFTMKDNEAQIRCAFFKNRHANLRFDIDNGMKVLAKANVGLYEGRGEYQLIIQQIEPAGAGALQIAFDALKQKLSSEGLFDEKHKKAIPKYAKTIGVITSETGAAIRDILTVLKRRYPLCDLIIYPVSVQGDEAAKMIANKIKVAEKRKECDVLIIARGGGSLEDLWAFNEEIVARAIFSIDTPIVSGIGHEIDFTITDFVADLRAPTPSAAAELVSPNIDELRQELEIREKQLVRFQKQIIKNYKKSIEILFKNLPRPDRKLIELMQRIDEHSIHLKHHFEKNISSKKITLTKIENRLTKLNPVYIVAQQLSHVNNLHFRFIGTIRSILKQKNSEIMSIKSILTSISPTATLERGYAIVTDYNTNKIVKNSDKLKIGKKLHVKLAESEIDSIVEKIYEK